MLKETENFYEEPCSRKCKIKEFWFMDVPGIDKKQVNPSTILICLGCIHYERKNHFIPVIDRGYKN